MDGNRRALARRSELGTAQALEVVFSEQDRQAFIPRGA